jgi:hypothetical protein
MNLKDDAYCTPPFSRRALKWDKGKERGKEIGIGRGLERGLCYAIMCVRNVILSVH